MHDILFSEQGDKKSRRSQQVLRDSVFTRPKSLQIFSQRRDMYKVWDISNSRVNSVMDTMGPIRKTRSRERERINKEETQDISLDLAPFLSPSFSFHICIWLVQQREVASNEAWGREENVTTSSIPRVIPLPFYPLFPWGWTSE